MRALTSPLPLARLLALAVALPLTLGACSATPTATGSTTTTRAASHQGVGSVCATVTPAQIARTLAKPVRTPGVTTSARTTVCTYPASGSDQASAAVIVGFRGGVTPADFTAEKAKLGTLHGSTTDISGIGDQAYSYSQDVGGHSVTSVATLVNRTQVTVTSTASIDQAEALTKEIFATFAAQTATTAP